MIPPVTRAQAEALVSLYNRVTDRCPGVPRDKQGRPIGRKVTATSVKEATAFLRFCAEHAIDPERWIVARHDAMGWKARVALAELHRVSDNYMAHFQTWGDSRAAEATRTVEPEDLDRPGPYAEALKATYAADPALCMVQPETRGWHPGSDWCRACPEAERCRRRLPAARRQAREQHAGE